MADVSVSDVPVTFGGVKFTLRASLESLVPLEREFDESYALLINRAVRGVPRAGDLSAVFAAFALPHGKHTAVGIRALVKMETAAKQMMELREHIKAALEAALPKAPAEAAEGGGNAPADPQ